MKIETQHTPPAVIAPAAPRASQPRSQEPEPPPPLIQDTRDDMLRTAQALRDALGPLFHTEPHFSVDQETKRLRIEIVSDSGEIVRQIPHEDVQRFTHIFDRLIGLMVDESI